MKRRAHLVTTTLVAVSAIALTAVWRPVPMLLWNASASVPIGLYAVRPTGTLTNGELVVATPPEPLAAYLGDDDISPGVSRLSSTSLRFRGSACVAAAPR